MDWAGKSVVVAGGLGGIGYFTCSSLLEKGVKNLGIFDIHENENLFKALTERKSLAKVKFWKVNATQKDEIGNGLRAAMGEFRSIDVLVNCVGIIDEMQPERCVETNLLATINLNYVAIDFMSRSKGGAGGTVVNIASVAGLRPYPPMPIYCATKHGVVGLTTCLGSDFYYETTGMKFMAVCPGLTVTPLIKTTIQSPLHGMKYFPDDLPRQSVEICGKLLVEAIEENKNGSVWTIIDGKLDENKFTALYE